MKQGLRKYVRIDGIGANVRRYYSVANVGRLCESRHEITLAEEWDQVTIVDDMCKCKDMHISIICETFVHITRILLLGCTQSLHAQNEFAIRHSPVCHKTRNTFPDYE